MEKKVKIISLSLLAVGIGIIIITTVIKVYDNHKESLLRVSSQKIEEAAKKCTLDEVCTEEKTTLGFLIEKGYLEKQVHPISKEFIDENLEITCVDYTCKTNID